MAIRYMTFHSLRQFDLKIVLVEPVFISCINVIYPELEPAFELCMLPLLHMNFLNNILTRKLCVMINILVVGI